MRHIISYIIVFAGLFSAGRAGAQTQEAAQLVLNYEKLLQLEEILDKMYDGYKILVTGYNTVKDIAEGNFNLHRLFLDGLLSVSPAVKNYRKVVYIIEYQKLLIEQSKRAYDRFKNDQNLTVREVQYIEQVFERLGIQSLNNLDELLMVVTASKLRMNDEERFSAIDRIYSQMERKLTFLKVFTSNTDGISKYRSKQKSDIDALRKVYGITN